MPTGRGGLAAAFDGSRVYALGGAAYGRALDTAEAYDPVSREWERLPPMPTARDHLAAASLDGRVHAIGGRNLLLSANTGAHEAYDAATGEWAELEALPTPRGGLAAVSIGGSVFVLGGEHTYGTFDENEHYVPGAGWLEAEPMPTARHGLGAAAVGERIYTIAGGVEPGGGVSGLAESYRDPVHVPEFGAAVVAMAAATAAAAGLGALTRREYA